MPLNARRKRFVAAYLSHPDGSRAYRQAGYAAKEAKSKASRLRRQPEVRAAIEEGQHRVLHEADNAVEHIVSAYARMAFATIDDVLRAEPDGSIQIDLTNRDGLAGLVDVEIDNDRAYRAGRTRVRRVRITLAAKLQALDALAIHLGIFARKRSGRAR